jgi:hypothetical protein
VGAFPLRVLCVQLDPLLTFEAYAKHKVPNARQLPLPKGFMPEEKYGRVLQELQSKYSAVVKRVCAQRPRRWRRSKRWRLRRCGNMRITYSPSM